MIERKQWEETFKQKDEKHERPILCRKRRHGQLSEDRKIEETVNHFKRKRERKIDRVRER